MTEKTIFTKAPITEALLDIQVVLPPEVDLSTLLTYQEAIKDRYPYKRERMFLEFGLEATKDRLAQTREPPGGVDGFFFDSPKREKIVQARLNGYSFSKLKPYENWEVFCEEAKDLWKHYCAIARPTNIVRLALRYINRIDIPLPLSDFNEYLLTIPEVAPGIPQGLSSFFMRLVIPDSETNLTAIVTELMEPTSLGQDKASIILDIDVFQVITIDTDDERIWDLFEQIRNYKNKIFFSSITEKANGLFV